MSGVLLESRPFRPFKSSEEYLIAMKEDLAEWLQMMYSYLEITPENFMERLETGVVLCEHANAVKVQAAEYVRRKEARRLMTKSTTGSIAQAQTLVEIPEVKFRPTAKAGTFFARDNLSNFIKWCRESLKILECLLFESDDLIMRKNEKHVILCLLEVARRGAKFGMLAPMLVQMERQIDREIAADQRMQASMLSEAVEENSQADDEESDSEMEDEHPMMMYGPIPQIVTNDLKSLDEMVRDLVERCTCATQFPMIRVSEGKYRIGDTKVLIFVRILRNHVMVRVGGGWDTLSHYLDKHDPCRCRAQHRATQGAKLVNRVGVDLQGAQVIYDRSGVGNTPNGSPTHTNTSPSKSLLGPPKNALNRSRSRSPSTFSQLDRRSASPYMQRKSLMPIPAANRSRSPTPNYVSTHTTKLASPKHQRTNGVKDSGPQSLPTTFTATKQRHPSNHVAHLNLPVAEATPIKGGAIKTEAVLMVNGSGDSTDHSDNASEVSDEGYRSLGIVPDKKHRSSVHSQNSIEDADEMDNMCINKRNKDCPETNDSGLRKTAYSSLIYDEVNAPSLGSKTPPLRRSPEKERMPLSPKKSASSSRLNLTLNSTNINNTWNGRARSRPSLSNEMFTPPPQAFSRNSPGRRSTSVPKYDNHGRRVSQSASTSPTKNIRDDLAQILHIANDEVMVVEVNKLLKQYAYHMLQEDDLASRRRKDSKPENTVSRIPAPVVNK